MKIHTPCLLVFRRFILACSLAFSSIASVLMKNVCLYLVRVLTSLSEQMRTRSFIASGGLVLTEEYFPAVIARR
jgi:hypothetical protein